MSDPSTLCGRCRHPFDPHVLVALEFGMHADVADVPLAGVMFCPACGCTATWSVQGVAPPVMPAVDALAELRAAALAEDRLRNE